MKVIIPLLLLLLFAFSAFAQTDAPIIGKISDLADKKKVFVDASNSYERKHIVKLLNKSELSLEIVDHPAEADFILESGLYFPGKSERRSGDEIKYELSAYYYDKNKTKVIAWQRTQLMGSGISVMDTIPLMMTARFIKDLKKAVNTK